MKEDAASMPYAERTVTFSGSSPVMGSTIRLAILSPQLKAAWDIMLYEISRKQVEEVEGDKRRQIDCDSTPARVSAYLPLQDRKKSSNPVDPLLHAFYPYSHLLCLLHTEHSQNGLQGRW